MDKKLPGIYANKIDGKVANNEKVAYSKNDKVKDSRVDEVKESEISFTSQKNINQKLSEIFNSPRYVYKADVTITLKDKQISTYKNGRCWKIRMVFYSPISKFLANTKFLDRRHS